MRTTLLVALISLDCTKSQPAFDRTRSQASEHVTPVPEAAAELSPQVSSPLDSLPYVFFAMHAAQFGSLDPIALQSNDSLLEPPLGETDPRTDRFRGHYLSQGKRYRVFHALEEIGSVLVLRAEEGGCSGPALNGFGTLELNKPVGEGALAIATDKPAIRSAPRARHEPTAAQLDELRRTAHRVYSDSGVAPRLLDQALPRKTAALVLPPTGDSAVIGTFVIEDTADGADEVIALFLVLEAGTAGYRPTMIWYHAGADAYLRVQQYLDLLDVTGDGVPEIITTFQYYESWDYAIYRRRPGAWDPIYKGGGGGC